MSEEWTEVEIAGRRIQYRDAPWLSSAAVEVMVEDEHGQEQRLDDGFATCFAMGMEAARQEIRERLERMRDDEWETVQDEWELRSRREQAAWANRRVALNDVLEIRTPPDSESES